MKKKVFAAIAIIVLFFLVTGGFYTVKENQYPVVQQFGKIVKIDDKAGPQLKLPIVQSVKKISAAKRLYDVPKTDVMTKDKKSMISDNYVIYKISDPSKFVRTLGASETRAKERIEAAVYNALKKIISSMTQDELIEARGEKLTELITKEARTGVEEYGILIVCSEIKALDLPDDNKTAVYSRMISERRKIAATYTASGEAEAAKIRNATDKETAKMKATANMEAEKTRAAAEKDYMEIMKAAYGSKERAEFYEFVRSMDALKESMAGKGEKTIILDKDSELARALYGNGLD